jgi:hypothetical protein
MIGKARAGMPIIQFETGRQLVKRFKAVQEAKEEFWHRWVKEIFPSLLKQKKWYKCKRDAKVGMSSSGRMRLPQARHTNLQESSVSVSAQMEKLGKQMWSIKYLGNLSSA